MGVYKYNNVSYDMNEKASYINYFTSEKVIPVGSIETFGSDVKFGYSSMGLYVLTILKGIVEAVDNYNYKSRIALVVKETYQDSDGSTHEINKLINLGGYVIEKNKPLTIKHLTPMYCGQLINIQGFIVNNSSHSITIKDLKLYKSMEYANSYIDGDLSGYDSAMGGHEDKEDVGDGTTELVFKNQLTYQFSSYYDSIYKLNDREYWFTSSKWFIKLHELKSSGSSYVMTEKNWKAFDDKGNFVGQNGEDGISLLYYSEYLAFYFDAEDIEDITGREPDRVIYMNNLGRKYGGTANTYHYRFIDTLKKDMGGFNSDNYPNNIEDNEKYDNSAGVLTFQLVINKEDETTETAYYYCSTQPFSYYFALNNWKSKPYLINGHIYWFLEGFRIGSSVSGDEYVTTSMVDVEYCTIDKFRKFKDSPNFYKEIFGEAVKNLTYIDKALEEQYPNGNLKDSGGGAW